MRWIKYGFMAVAGLLFLCILSVAFLLLVLDDDGYRRLAVFGVDCFTDYKISIDGPFKMEISSYPYVYAEDIRLESKDKPSPLGTIGKFSARLDLRKLVSGAFVVRELRTEEVFLEIIVDRPDEPGDVPEDEPVPFGDIALPVFESVMLRDIRLDAIDSSNDRTTEIRVRKLNIEEVDDTCPIFVSGEGSINGREFDIEGHMGSPSAALKQENPYPVDCTINYEGVLRLSVEGTFDNYIKAEGMDLHISGEAVEFADLLRLFHMESLPLGRLQFYGNIVHDLDAPGIPSFRIELSGSPRIRFEAKGAVANALTGEGADVDFSGSFPVSEILHAVDFQKTGGLESLKISGRLQEAYGVLSATNFKMEAVSEKGVEVGAEGRIEFGGLATRSIKKKLVLDLDLKAFYPTSNELRPLLFERLPEVGPVVARAKLKGSPSSLSLNDFTIEAGGQGPLRLKSRGRLSGKILDQGLIATGFDLESTIDSENTAILAAAYGADLPELGAVSAKYRLRGNLERFRLEQIDLQTETAQGLKTEFTGNVEFVRRSSDNPVGSLDIQTRVHAPTVGAAAFPWGAELLSGLSDLKNLQATAMISGTTKAPSLKKIEIKTGDPSLMQISIGGDIERILYSPDRPVSGIRLEASIMAASTARISNALSIRLPDWGPLLLKARIADGQGYLDVENFKITGGKGEKPSFSAKGRILRLFDPEGAVLLASFETASLPWVETYLGRTDAKNATLGGEIEAKRKTNGLRLDTFFLGAADEKNFKLEASGDIDDFSGAPKIDVRITVAASDPVEIGSLLGMQIPNLKPVALEGRISGKIPDLNYDGKFRVGETAIASEIVATVVDGRPGIRGKIAANTIDLSDIGMSPGAPPPKTPAARKLKFKEKKRLFSQDPLPSFDALRSFDLVLSIDADKLIGNNVVIENLDIDFLLDKGKLHIHPASLAYSAGFTDMDFTIDATGEAPRFALKITGEDIEIEDVLTYAHDPLILSGSLNLVADLKSSGTSMHAIAANLNGVFSAALENGQVRRIVNLLSKDAFDLVLTSAEQRTYTEMHCLANKINFQDGTGNIEILYLDTPKIRAKGAGKINLADETIDVVINPQRKGSLLKRRSAVRLHGSLSNPSAFTLPLTEAAELYGTIMLPFVMLPARGLGYLWTLLSTDKEISPCSRGFDPE